MLLNYSQARLITGLLVNVYVANGPEQINFLCATLGSTIQINFNWIEAIGLFMGRLAPFGAS